MAMQIIDGAKLDRSLKATADRIREVTGETGDIPFDYAGETGFAEAIPEGGGGGGTLRPLIATENRVYTPPEGVDGFDIVTVAVETPQYSPRCDVVSTFNWGFLQGYWGFDDVYPTEYPPAPPDPGPDPDPPAPSLYPQWATGSDAEIAALLDAAAAGSVDLQRDAGWAVGDVRRIHVDAFDAGPAGAGILNPAEDLDIVISSFDNYNNCGNLLQFDFKTSISIPVYMNSAATTSGGYRPTVPHMWTLPALSEALPDWMQERLKPFSVVTRIYFDEADPLTDIIEDNKLSLRSYSEVFGSSEAGFVEGPQLAYYQTQENRIKTHGINGSAVNWWLRTYDPISPSTNFITGSLIGTVSAGQANNYFSVAPFGCLGGYEEPVPPEPTPPEPSAWSTGTDADVANLLDAAAAGTIDLQQDAGWWIGEKRRIHVDSFTSGSVTAPAEDVDIVITGFGDYGGSGGLIQFDFASSLSTAFRISANNTTQYGYGDTEMYRQTLPALAEALPTWLKSRLKPFSVQASAGGAELSRIETIPGNILALRSYSEIFGTSRGYRDEGTQLEYYTAAETRIKTLGLSGTAGNWWVRSAVSSGRFGHITDTGADTGGSPLPNTTPQGISPFGCLGGYAEPAPGPMIVDFDKGTDAQIAALIDAAQAGTIDLQQDAGWAVGDVRHITVSSFTGANNRVSPEQVLAIVITSFDEYQSCGNVMQFDFLWTPTQAFPQNLTATNVGGYGASAMKTVTMPAMADALPAWLKSRLRTFSVLADDGSGTVAPVSGNKLALRSRSEIFGTSSGSLPDEGAQLAYYQTPENRLKTMIGLVDPADWWLRTAEPNTSDKFRVVWRTGSELGGNATSNYSLAPFGCL